MLKLDRRDVTIASFRSARLAAPQPGAPRPRALRLAIEGVDLFGLDQVAPILGCSRTVVARLYRAVPAAAGGQEIVEPVVATGPWPLVRDIDGALVVRLGGEDFRLTGRFTDIRVELIVSEVAAAKLSAAFLVEVGDVPDGFVEALAPRVGQLLPCVTELSVAEQPGLFDGVAVEPVP
jgi:hypothetical protein